MPKTKQPLKAATPPAIKLETNGQPKPESWVGKIPHIKQGTYPDGLPYPEFNYLAFKLILKPNRFVSRDSMFQFAKVIKGPAAEHGVEFKIGNLIDAPIKTREIVFVDTDDFRLYNIHSYCAGAQNTRTAFQPVIPRSFLNSGIPICKQLQKLM